MILLFYKKGLNMDPPAHIKAKYKRELGLYPKDGLNPFGPEHFVTMGQGAGQSLHGFAIGMMHQPQTGPTQALPPVLANLLATREKPKFSGKI